VLAKGPIGDGYARVPSIIIPKEVPLGKIANAPNFGATKWRHT